MQFSDTQQSQGTKFTKIAIVSALHLAVGAAIVHNMDAKVFSMPKAVEEIIMFDVKAPEPPPPPPEPPQPKQKAVTPTKVFTPPVEVEVAQEPPPKLDMRRKENRHLRDAMARIYGEPDA